MKMIALTHHTYDGRGYAPGDTYDADPLYVETLEAIQFAKRADDVPIVAPAPVSSRVPDRPTVDPPAPEHRTPTLKRPAGR